MIEQRDALLDVRARMVARFADFDVKVLTLLFGIAAAWGIIKGISLPGGPLIAIVLAFAGLFVSVGWVVQRRMLWRVEDSYAEAIRAMAKADGPLAHAPALDRASATGGGWQYGAPLSMAVFALLAAVAVWSYQAPVPLSEPDMAMLAPEESGDAFGAPDLIRAVPIGDGQQWVLVSPYQMQVVTLANAAEDQGCPCDPEYSVAFAPMSQDDYAPLPRHMPIDPERP